MIISPSSRPKHGRASVDSFSKIVMRIRLKITMMLIMVMMMMMMMTLIMIITALLEGYQLIVSVSHGRLGTKVISFHCLLPP